MPRETKEARSRVSERGGGKAKIGILIGFLTFDPHPRVGLRRSLLDRQMADLSELNLAITITTVGQSSQHRTQRDGEPPETI